MDKRVLEGPNEKIMILEETKIKNRNILNDKKENSWYFTRKNIYTYIYEKQKIVRQTYDLPFTS